MDTKHVLQTLADGALQSSGGMALNYALDRVKMWWRAGYVMMPRNDSFKPLPLTIEYAPLEVMTLAKRVGWALDDAREAEPDSVLLRRLERLARRIDRDEDFATLFAITNVVVWVFGDAGAVTLEASGDSVLVSAVQTTYRNGPVISRTNTSLRVLALLAEDIAMPRREGDPLVFDVGDIRVINSILRVADAPEPTRPVGFSPALGPKR